MFVSHLCYIREVRYEREAVLVPAADVRLEEDVILPYPFSTPPAAGSSQKLHNIFSSSSCSSSRTRVGYTEPINTLVFILFKKTMTKKNIQPVFSMTEMK